MMRSKVTPAYHARFDSGKSVSEWRRFRDRDILIDSFNTGRLSRLLDDPRNQIYYSIVTSKELLAKEGLKATERQAIDEDLHRFRLIPLGPAIAARYSALRRQYPNLEKEDALIAATALVKRLPLMTRNWKHFRQIDGLTLYAGR